jgi:DNA modification methylase
MKTLNIINKLKGLGIYLFLYGSNLRFRASQDAITDDIIALLRQHKRSLCTLLRVGNPYNLPMVIKRPLKTLGGGSAKKKKLIPSGAMTRLFHGDCNSVLDQLEENSVDGGFTDPPYGIKFMGKKWDKAIPSVDTWKKYFKVLKPGAWMIVFSSPRQDQLSRMITNLEDAGFFTGFTSLYWTYAAGFPKYHYVSNHLRKKGYSSEAEALEGAYAGFQPKPAVEVIIVAMKPLVEKSYTSQAISNGKGITWFDDCRIPYGVRSPNIGNRHKHGRGEGYGFKPQWKAKGGVQWSPEKKWKQDIERQAHEKGRFPANLLVSGDVLDDGKKRAAGKYSNFFSLDAWVEKNLPFLIVPKANKKEKNAGLDKIEPTVTNDGRKKPIDNPYQRGMTKRHNSHPTVKPIELLLYLITMFTRPGDTIIDSYVGTGTTCLAAQILGRRCIGIELEEEYFNIAAAKHYARRFENYYKGAV